MVRKPVLMVLLGLSAALILAGCSKQEPEFTAQDQVAAADRTEDPADGGGGGGQAGPAVAFVAENIEFTQAPDEVPAGRVTIELQNLSALPHDVTIEGKDTVVETTASESATGSVELEPGEYTYYCSVPGHRATMEGTFTVVEGEADTPGPSPTETG